jgi:hypothetical protein
MPKMKKILEVNHIEFLIESDHHKTNPKKGLIDPITPCILAGGNWLLLARGQGATNTSWSSVVNGKPSTMQKSVVILGEKWYD